MMAEKRTIVVTGATGLQGGAVTRHLLADGWHVRALTRNSKSKKAQALATLGVEVVQGDMNDAKTLRPVFEGAYGVFSVQNTMSSGVEGEIAQGKNVATAAKQTDIQHLVYSSAATPVKGTGVPAWESKLDIEGYIKALALPWTVLRPTACMELMTEKQFFPPVSVWHVMPKLMGSARRLGWLCTDDLGLIVAKLFSASEQYIGQELLLASDIKSIDECRATYRAVTGKRPTRIPMPAWMFERLGPTQNLTIMWRWLRDGRLNFETDETFGIHPNAMSIQTWLEKKTNPQRPT